jgi:ADP-heptose:LPS heptosyltransferase
VETQRHRILVIARGHLGDLVGALPALRDLRSAYPTAHITAVTNEYVEGALDHCPFVDEVIYGFGYGRRRWERVVRGIKLALGIGGRYDTAIALRMSPPVAPLIMLLSGARTRVGFDRPGFTSRLITHRIDQQPGDLSNRVVNMKPMAALGLATDPGYPTISWLPDQVRSETTRLLGASGASGAAGYAVFQLSSHWGCYEWRSEKWAALADRLIRQHDLQIVVTGTGDGFELAKYQEVQRLAQGRLIPLLGKTTLPELFDVVGRARLVVAVDSALTQIALAQRAPAVMLFGIEPAVRNGPLPDETHTLAEPIQHWEGPGLAPHPNPHCKFGESQCHTNYCRENSSLQRITVDEVAQRASAILNAQTAGSRVMSNGQIT